MEVNDVPFPQYGPKGDKRWEYSISANAIDFDPLAVPDPDSTIEVTYRVCP